MKYDRDKLEQALSAVMNCNTMEESLEEFRRHMGVTIYSDPANQNLLAFASIGHNARVSDFIVNEKQQLELSLILQELKNLFDDMYPSWTTLNLELKGEINTVEIHDWVKIGFTQNKLEIHYECSNCPAKKRVHQCPPGNDKGCNAKDLIWDEVIEGKCVSEYCDNCGKPNLWAECPNKIDCPKWDRQHCNTINCEEECII